MSNCKKRPVGSVTLIGSGEMAPGMSKTHRVLLSAIKGPVTAVFLDTPAGFQLNVDQISEKAVQYFKQHFSLNLAVASFKSAHCTGHEINKALAALVDANYIFAGPGSPTYVIRNWENTQIINALQSRLINGAHLVFASAASIAIGAFALPVYEIYKVGEPPVWAKGLNFLKSYGYEPVIIPHWNNKEGGTHDTRFCYMGAPRFKMLEDQLSNGVPVIGIDEHTALKLDLDQEIGQVMGAGNVTIRKKGEQVLFRAGDSFLLKLLNKEDRSNSLGVHPKEESDSACWPFPEFENSVECPSTDIPSHVIDFIVSIRSELRNEQNWKLSDKIRSKLLDYGIILEDDPAGTVWKKG